jgi:signal transduction histidine kinase
VLFNLLSNAFKFTPASGTVRLRLLAGETDAAAPDAGFRLEVGDSGPGVPPEERERVFARFARGAGETARRTGGTGLGLSIVKDLVELHGGRVEIGTAPEGGALFTIRVPARAAREVPAPADRAPGDEYAAAVVEELQPTPPEAVVPAPPAPGPARSRVLVVEDNPEMGAFLTNVLGEGHDVTLARDGEEGLAAALARPPDAIVTDIMMPRMSGDRLVRELRARPELDPVPVLVLTARADDALRIRLLREGAQDYVMKPFVVEEVRARVANLVAIKRAREMLQAEVQGRTNDLVDLAAEVTLRKREAETALELARRAREDAERASAVKSSFLRLVSHELRTPLTSLHLHLQRLLRERESPLSTAQRDTVRRAGFAVTRLTGLVEALLFEAQIASGRLAAQLEDVDVVTLVRGVIEEVRPIAEQKGLTLDLRGREDVPWIQTEPRFLRLIMSNLVGNAIKYTSAGRVEVDVAAVGDGLQLEVRDTGPGIPAGDLARVFEPFERGQGVAERFVPGIGLGLALVRDLAAAIGAQVELRSTPGVGSTFAVLLPSRHRRRGAATGDGADGTRA